MVPVPLFMLAPPPMLHMQLLPQISTHLCFRLKPYALPAKVPENTGRHPRQKCEGGNGLNPRPWDKIRDSQDPNMSARPYLVVWSQTNDGSKADKYQNAC
jgi:hypothetical protein